MTFNPATLFFKEVSIVGLSSFNMSPEQLRAELEFVSAGTDAGGGGWVRPVVGKKFALADGAGGGNDALHEVFSQPGGARGKIVIVPWSFELKPEALSVLLYSTNNVHTVL